MAFLQIQGISKQYGGLWALANVTFDVAQGEIVSVIGPNGAGKTTLFDCLTGFVPPDAGHMRFQDADITDLSADLINAAGIARTFQQVRRPKLLVVDEPSMGLSPLYVNRSFELISRVHAEGVTILVLEQNANMALAIADRGYVLQVGEIVLSGKAADLRGDPAMRNAYLNTARKD